MVETKTVCPPDHKHWKTLTCYQNHGCRCEECLQGYSERNKRTYQRAKARRVVVIGTDPFTRQQMRKGLAMLLEMEEEKFDLLVD